MRVTGKRSWGRNSLELLPTNDLEPDECLGLEGCCRIVLDWPWSSGNGIESQSG